MVRRLMKARGAFKGIQIRAFITSIHTHTHTPANTRTLVMGLMACSVCIEIVKYSE